MQRRFLPIRLSLAVGFVACTPGSPLPAASERPNFLLVDIDSLRADRPFAERNGQPVMPNVQALTRRGVRFTSAFAHSGWTAPALVSLLTGHLPVPIEIGSRSTAVFPPGARTFTEVLSLYGYQTTILWGPGTEASIPDYSQGFSVRLQHGFRDRDEDPIGHALRDDTFTEPFALMLHDFDAHAPPPALRVGSGRTFGEEDLDCGGGPYPEMVGRLTPELGGERATAHALAHYDGTLHTYDAFLGALFASMEARGVLARTVVVVISNHGEDIGDRGVGLRHGSLYDVLLRVPLVVAGPGVGPAGRIVDTPVQGVDLAPTLVALADAPQDRSLVGISFLPLLAGEEMGGAYSERSVFSLTNAKNASVRTPTRKLMTVDRPNWRPPDAPSEASSGGSYEYYDLVVDPEERADLYPTRGAEAVDLERALTAFVEEQRAAAEGAREDVDPEVRERFRDEGYWGIVGGEDPPP